MIEALDAPLPWGGLEDRFRDVELRRFARADGLSVRASRPYEHVRPASLARFEGEQIVPRGGERPHFALKLGGADRDRHALPEVVVAERAHREGEKAHEPERQPVRRARERSGDGGRLAATEQRGQLVAVFLREEQGEPQADGSR